MTRALLLAALLGAPLAAEAFCGTYVGAPGAELYANTSQVLMVRQGERTTLTLTNDYDGDLMEFAMVIPVPEVLQEGDVTLGDAELLDRLAVYTGPRLVRYTCADFEWDYDDPDWGYVDDCDELEDEPAGSSGCSGMTSTRRRQSECAQADWDMDYDTDLDSAAPPALKVDVESSFTVGAYEIVVLSSEDSGDLVTWLQREGYGVSAEAEELLGEYLEAGSFFFAAKVKLDAIPEADAFLPPLRVSYTSEVFSLPIKLGTLNSPGSQDLVLYTVTDSGEVGIANYPEVSITDECMHRDATAENLSDVVLGDFGDAVEAKGGAGWMLEYSWNNAKCDPCPPDGSLDPEDVLATGFVGDTSKAHVSRLRLRYPADAEADLMLYDSDVSSMEQLRYIVYDEPLEEHLDVCNEPPGDGTCEDDDETGRRRRDASLPPWLPLGFIVSVGVAGWATRRRSRSV